MILCVADRLCCLKIARWRFKFENSKEFGIERRNVKLGNKKTKRQGYASDGSPVLKQSIAL